MNGGHTGVVAKEGAYSLFISRREWLGEHPPPGRPASPGVRAGSLALNQITGSSIPQGVAAVLIGLVLIRTSLRLVKRSHDFLVGVWPLTPEASPRRWSAASSRV